MFPPPPPLEALTPGKLSEDKRTEYFKSLSRVQLFETPWMVACQAPLSTEFSRQEYWSEMPSPSTGDLSNPVIEPESPLWQADSLPSEPIFQRH